MIKYPNNFKYSIKRFTKEYSKYEAYSSKDINHYIDVLYRIDSIINYDLTKMSPIIDLIIVEDNNKCYKSILQLNKYLKRHISKIGMTRILEDLGFPHPDISVINRVQASKPDLKNIDSLLSYVKRRNFNNLSPFGKELIDDYLAE